MNAVSETSLTDFPLVVSDRNCMGSTSTNSVCPSVFTNAFAAVLAGPGAKHKDITVHKLTLESVAWDFPLCEHL